MFGVCWPSKRLAIAHILVNSPSFPPRRSWCPVSPLQGVEMSQDEFCTAQIVQTNFDLQRTIEDGMDLMDLIYFDGPLTPLEESESESAAESESDDSYTDGYVMIFSNTDEGRSYRI